VSQINSHLDHVQSSLTKLSTISYLLANEFELYLVGGATRDFLLTGSLSYDLDIEIQNTNSKSVEDLSTEIESELKHKQIKFEKLNFNIFRVFEGDYELELSFPRLESYPTLAQGAARKHDDFETKILTNEPIKHSFQRRDLSINAMAIKLEGQKISFEDPFNGLESLIKKEAVQVGTDFNKDPVRFLRMIRFELRFDLNLSTSIKDDCTDFNLLECSDFHFLREYEKCNNPKFLNKFFSYAEEFNIAFPKRWIAFKGFKNIAYGDIDQNLYSFWQIHLDKVETLKDCQTMLRLKADIFKKFASIEQAKKVFKVPKYANTGDLEQFSSEEIEELKNLRILIQNIEILKKYSIPVFDFKWLENFAEKVSENKPSKDDLLSAPEKLRWMLPLIKNLTD
jgi:hypothetical protein